MHLVAGRIGRVGQQMFQIRIVFDSLQLLFDNTHYVGFDFLVVALNLLLHDVVSCGIAELVDDGNRAIGFRLGVNGCIVHDDLRMENLLLNLLADVVRHGPDKCPLREVGDLRGRNQGVELRADGGR